VKDQIPEEYKELVHRSVFKQYTNTDRQRLGMEPTPKTEIFRQNPWSINRYCNAKKSKFNPVLIIPSLINRNYIMDLLPEHSLIESMVKAGLDVFVIDWGDPDPGMGNVGFDHYVGTWVKRAVRQVKKLTKKKKIQLAGQCLGGLMAAMYVAHPELKKDIEKVFLLTAPLDFEDSGLLSNWTSSSDFDIEKLTAAHIGIVPADFFHASFPFLDVKKQLGKYRSLLENFSIPGFKEIWEALDIWASDNVCFTKKAFIELIKDFYQENSFYKGTFTIKGQNISVKNIDIPVLSLVAKEDHVFTEKAASAIKESKAAKKGKLTYKILQAGHVTLISAHPARLESYKAVNEFLTNQE
jgi:polyhydroxyalkanoate synthase